MCEKSLKFHVENHDYFGTLATVLNLIKDRLNENIFDTERLMLKNKIEELKILQDDYLIEKKD